MSDKFKILIDSDRDLFDAQMPSPELWNRIEAQMGHRPQRSGLSISIALKSVAAVLLVTLLSVAGWHVMKQRTASTQSLQLSAIDAQVMEAAQFYETQISQKEKEVMQLTSHQPEVRDGMQQDMAELDQALRELKADLKDNISNAEVLEAMIQTYRMKLDILEQILSYLQPDNSQPSNESKQPSYEL